MKVLLINGSPHEKGCTYTALEEAADAAGTTAAFARLNKYFSISRMSVVTSQYWNPVHGFTPDNVRKDEEGLQTMRTLRYNMSWMLKNITGGNQPTSEIEPWQPTHFIR